MHTPRLIFYAMRDIAADAYARGLLAFTFSIVSLATLVFWILEDWTLLDSAFFAVATISTVGYGDIVPQTALGKVFCMVYIVLGLGVFVAAAGAIAEMLIRRRNKEEERR